MNNLLKYLGVDVRIIFEPDLREMRSCQINAAGSGYGLSGFAVNKSKRNYRFNPLNAELNPICHLLALLGVHFLHVGRISVKSLTLRLLMSYIYIYIYIWSTYS